MCQRNAAGCCQAVCGRRLTHWQIRVVAANDRFAFAEYRLTDFNQKQPVVNNRHFNFQRQLNRRTLLRGTGVSLSLPWLTAMQSAFAGVEEPEAPRRFVAMTLGLVADNLNPEQAGFGYESSIYLKPL